MTDEGLSKRKLPRALKWGLVITGILLLVSFIPLPLREYDKTVVARKTLNSLLARKRVLIWARHCPLYVPFFDAEAASSGRNVLYLNDADIDESVFVGIGLLKYSDEMKCQERFDFYNDNVLVAFTYTDIFGTKGTSLLFSFSHGSMGGQGYKLIVYRTVWGCLVVYVLDWVS